MSQKTLDIPREIQNNCNAFFWVTLSLGDDNIGTLDAAQIEYNICNKNHNPSAFWENTQNMIYQNAKQRISLMGILYNELKHKRSIHLIAEIDSSSYKSDVKILDDDALLIDLKIPEKYILNDTNFKYTHSSSKVKLYDLISTGYDFAEKQSNPNIDNILNFIHNISDEITDKLQKDKRYKCETEERESIYRLISNAIAYVYPSREFPHKSFSSLLCKYTRQDNVEISSGGLFLLWNNDIIKNSEDFKEIIKNKAFLCAKNIAYEFCANKTTSELLAQVRKQSIKSARAAIMSRNMSHNLGSHVMSYLKQHLGSVKDMLNEGVLSILLDDEADLVRKLGSLNSIKDTVAYSEWSNLLNKLDSLNSKVINCDKVALPFLVGLGHFISYLQERQDFIATIATDFIPYYSTVNFKDFVYDELNPDKRYERHKGENMQIDNILLGNIARSEGLGRSTSPTKKMQSSNNWGDIIIKFRDFDGNPVVKGSKDARSRSLNEMRQYGVSLPGGIVGRQAIFSIVENVIRNAAKHGNWRDSKKLELTFDIYMKEDIVKDAAHKPLDDDNESGHTLFDVLTKYYKNAPDSNDLYFVTLTDNLICKTEKLEKLRAAIVEEYVDENGNMKETNKGIKEMKISASWLRSIKNDGFDAKDDRAPILYARTSNGHLQYIFCLMRPKKVAIISSMFESGKNYIEEEFVKISWGAFTLSEFVSLSNKSYEFILYDDLRYNKNEYNQIRRISSSRLYKLSEICGNGEFPSYDELFRKIEAGFGEQEAERLLTELYKYIANYQEMDCISVIDETAHMNNNGGSRPFIQKGIVTICKSISDKNTTHPYVYLSHYETKDNFDKAYDLLKHGGLYENNRFIEGITGNNSTDRLVRLEKLNDLWAYKHLHAMKEQIAIFDERIFSKVFGIEEEKIRRSVIKDDIKKYDLSELKNNYIKYFDTHRVSYNIIDDDAFYVLCNDINNCDSIDGLLDFLREYGCTKRFSNESIYSNSYMGTAFVQKGIYVFTLIKKDDDKNQKNIFYLCGLQWSTNEVISTLQMINGEYRSKCEVLAIVGWDELNNELLIEQHEYTKTPEGKYLGLFDKISIHQGLLDKLYEGFAISDNPLAKECLTKGLYKYFSKNKGKEILNFTIRKDNDDIKKWYLPGMCIHSGRSKPSEADMPQHLPFIQYAAIEHAVFDCKYSLVELLDYARYE